MPAKNLLEIVDKLVLVNKSVIREGKRYKIYLDSRYNDIWKELEDKKVDIIILIKQ